MEYPQPSGHGLSERSKRESEARTKRVSSLGEQAAPKNYFPSDIKFNFYK